MFAENLFIVSADVLIEHKYHYFFFHPIRLSCLPDSGPDSGSIGSHAEFLCEGAELGACGEILYRGNYGEDILHVVGKD